MTKRVSATIVFMILASFAAGAIQSAAAEEIVGIMWRLGYRGKDGEKNWVGRFRATPDGKVWMHYESGGKPKIIGTWTGNEENTKVTVNQITDPKYKKFNGNYEIVMVGVNPKSWEGTYTNPNTGATRPMLVELIRD